MATLYVRKVPEDLYRALARRAREQRSSIAAEAIRLLRRALSIEGPGRRELIESIIRDREPIAAGAPAPADLIREDRDR